MAYMQAIIITCKIHVPVIVHSTNLKQATVTFMLHCIRLKQSILKNLCIIHLMNIHKLVNFQQSTIHF